ncbi:MAG: alpha-glucosidase C-terminal domain-containing protein, partial [Clostridium sp.]
KEEDIIAYGDYKMLLSDNNQVYAYKRSLNNESIIVVNNFYDKECTIDLSDEIKSNNVEVLISNYEYNHEDISNVNLRPYESFAIKISK